MKNYYEILEVNENASKEVIDKAYKVLAKKYHPDLQEEKNKNARPALKTQIDNIDEYDTIFLGYPIWWGDMPMALYTFLDEYDLNGKTIAPFTTSGGSGLSGTLRNIEDEEPNSTVTEGLAIRDDNVKNSQNTVIEWLSEIGF